MYRVPFGEEVVVMVADEVTMDPVVYVHFKAPEVASNWVAAPQNKPGGSQGTPRKNTAHIQKLYRIVTPVVQDCRFRQNAQSAAAHTHIDG